MGVGLGLFIGLLELGACSTYGDELLTSSIAAGGSGGADVAGGAGTSDSSGGAASVAGSSSSGGSSSGAATGGLGSSDAGAAGVGDSWGGGTGAHAGAGGTGPIGGGGAGSGAGGTSGSAGTTAGSGGIPGIDMIDDFELNDPSMQVMLNNGRNGYWYAFHDATATGVQTFGIKKPADRAGSTYALHMTATGYTDYGAGFGADFVNVAKVKEPYDVSAYKGIRFYAKVAASTQAALKLLIPTTYSDIMGGKCTAAAGVSQCSDHLYCAIGPVTTAWAVYECDFANLKQVGFGLKQTSLDPKSVYSVQFTFLTATLAADVWVDDVAFVLK